MPTLRAQLREARARVQAVIKDKEEALAEQQEQHDKDKAGIMDYAEGEYSSAQDKIERLEQENEQLRRDAD